MGLWQGAAAGVCAAQAACALLERVRQVALHVQLLPGAARLLRPRTGPGITGQATASGAVHQSRPVRSPAR